MGQIWPAPLIVIAKRLRVYLDTRLHLDRNAIAILPMTTSETPKRKRIFKILKVFLLCLIALVLWCFAVDRILINQVNGRTEALLSSMTKVEADPDYSAFEYKIPAWLFPMHMLYGDTIRQQSWSRGDWGGELPVPDSIKNENPKDAYYSVVIPTYDEGSNPAPFQAGNYIVTVEAGSGPQMKFYLVDRNQKVLKVLKRKAETEEKG